MPTSRRGGSLRKKKKGRGACATPKEKQSKETAECSPLHLPYNELQGQHGQMELACIADGHDLFQQYQDAGLPQSIMSMTQRRRSNRLHLHLTPQRKTIQAQYQFLKKKVRTIFTPKSSLEPLEETRMPFLRRKMLKSTSEPDLTTGKVSQELTRLSASYACNEDKEAAISQQKEASNANARNDALPLQQNHAGSLACSPEQQPDEAGNDDDWSPGSGRPSPPQDDDEPPDRRSWLPVSVRAIRQENLTSAGLSLEKEFQNEQRQQSPVEQRRLSFIDTHLMDLRKEMANFIQTAINASVVDDFDYSTFDNNLMDQPVPAPRRVSLVALRPLPTEEDQPLVEAVKDTPREEKGEKEKSPKTRLIPSPDLNDDLQEEILSTATLSSTVAQLVAGNRVSIGTPPRAALSLVYDASSRRQDVSIEADRDGPEDTPKTPRPHRLTGTRPKTSRPAPRPAPRTPVINDRRVDIIADLPPCDPSLTNLQKAEHYNAQGRDERDSWYWHWVFNVPDWETLQLAQSAAGLLAWKYCRKYHRWIERNGVEGAARLLPAFKEAIVDAEWKKASHRPSEQPVAHQYRWPQGGPAPRDTENLQNYYRITCTGFCGKIHIPEGQGRHWIYNPDEACESMERCIVAKHKKAQGEYKKEDGHKARYARRCKTKERRAKARRDLKTLSAESQRIQEMLGPVPNAWPTDPEAFLPLREFQRALDDAMIRLLEAHKDVTYLFDLHEMCSSNGEWRSQLQSIDDYIRLYKKMVNEHTKYFVVYLTNISSISTRIRSDEALGNDTAHWRMVAQVFVKFPFMRDNQVGNINNEDEEQVQPYEDDVDHLIGRYTASLRACRLSDYELGERDEPDLSSSDEEDEETEQQERDFARYNNHKLSFGTPSAETSELLFTPGTSSPKGKRRATPPSIDLDTTHAPEETSSPASEMLQEDMEEVKALSQRFPPLTPEQLRQELAPLENVHDILEISTSHEEEFPDENKKTPGAASQRSADDPHDVVQKVIEALTPQSVKSRRLTTHDDDSSATTTRSYEEPKGQKRKSAKKMSQKRAKNEQESSSEADYVEQAKLSVDLQPRPMPPPAARSGKSKEPEQKAREGADSFLTDEEISLISCIREEPTWPDLSKRHPRPSLAWTGVVPQHGDPATLSESAHNDYRLGFPRFIPRSTTTPDQVPRRGPGHSYLPRFHSRNQWLKKRTTEDLESTHMQHKMVNVTADDPTADYRLLWRMWTDWMIRKKDHVITENARRHLADWRARRRTETWKEDSAKFEAILSQISQTYCSYEDRAEKQSFCLSLLKDRSQREHSARFRAIQILKFDVFRPFREEAPHDPAGGRFHEGLLDLGERYPAYRALENAYDYEVKRDVTEAVSEFTESKQWRDRFNDAWILQEHLESSKNAQARLYQSRVDSQEKAPASQNLLASQRLVEVLQKKILALEKTVQVQTTQISSNQKRANGRERQDAKNLVEIRMQLSSSLEGESLTATKLEQLESQLAAQEQKFADLKKENDDLHYKMESAPALQQKIDDLVQENWTLQEQVETTTRRNIALKKEAAHTTSYRKSVGRKLTEATKALTAAAEEQRQFELRGISGSSPQKRLATTTTQSPQKRPTTHTVERLPPSETPAATASTLSTKTKRANPPLHAKRRVTVVLDPPTATVTSTTPRTPATATAGESPSFTLINDETDLRGALDKRARDKKKKGTVTLINQTDGADELSSGEGEGEGSDESSEEEHDERVENILDRDDDPLVIARKQDEDRRNALHAQERMDDDIDPREVAAQQDQERRQELAARARQEQLRQDELDIQQADAHMHAMRVCTDDDPSEFTPMEPEEQRVAVANGRMTPGEAIARDLARTYLPGLQLVVMNSAYPHNFMRQYNTHAKRLKLQANTEQQRDEHKVAQNELCLVARAIMLQNYRSSEHTPEMIEKFKKDRIKANPDVANRDPEEIPKKQGADPDLPNFYCKNYCIVLRDSPRTDASRCIRQNIVAARAKRQRELRDREVPSLSELNGGIRCKYMRQALSEFNLEWNLYEAQYHEGSRAYASRASIWASTLNHFIEKWRPLGYFNDYYRNGEEEMNMRDQRRDVIPPPPLSDYTGTEKPDWLDMIPKLDRQVFIAYMYSLRPHNTPSEASTTQLRTGARSENARASQTSRHTSVVLERQDTPATTLRFHTPDTQTLPRIPQIDGQQFLERTLTPFPEMPSTHESDMPVFDGDSAGTKRRKQIRGHKTQLHMTMRNEQMQRYNDERVQLRHDEQMRAQAEQRKLTAQQNWKKTTTIAKFSGKETDVHTAFIKFHRAWVIIEERMRAQDETNVAIYQSLLANLQLKARDIALRYDLHTNPAAHAMAALVKTFWDQRILVEAFLDKVVNWPKMGDGPEAAAQWIAYDNNVTSMRHALDLTAEQALHMIMNAYRVPRLATRCYNLLNKTLKAKRKKDPKKKLQILSQTEWEALLTQHLEDETDHVLNKGKNRTTPLQAPPPMPPPPAKKAAAKTVKKGAVHVATGAVKKEPAQEKQTQKPAFKCILDCNTATAHAPAGCKVMKDLKVQERWAQAKKSQLCFSCLRAECQKTCGKKCGTCQSPHHSLLHDADRNAKKTTKSAGSGSNATLLPKNLTTSGGNLGGNKNNSAKRKKGQVHYASTSRSSTDIFPTCRVKVSTPGNTEAIILRVLLDSGSDTTLITRKAARCLLSVGRPVQLVMAVAGDKEVVPTSEHNVTLTMTSLDGKFVTEEFEATTIGSITSNFAPYDLNLQDYPHLQGITPNDPPDGKDQAVDILLSGKLCAHLITGGPRKGRTDEPCATPTLMGWVLSGGKPGGEVTEQKRSFTVQAVVKTTVDLHDFWTIEHQGILPEDKREAAMTLDELSAWQQMRDLTTYDEETKTYHSGLLWKKDPSNLLHNNMGRACAIMNSIRRKGDKDPEKLKAIDEQYRVLLREGFADTLTPAEINQTSTHTYVLESHAVFKPSSLSTKVRLVHNAKATDQISGESLNGLLKPGPNLLPELPAVFTRFRLGKYAVIADISKMFFRIKLPLKDQDYLRMVWHFTGEDRLTVMRMNSLPFGLTCSPFMAIFVVQHNAEKFKDLYPQAKEICKNIYMDDLSTTCDTKEEMKNHVAQMIGCFSMSSMDLHKWAANDPEILADVVRKTATTFYPDRIANVLGAAWDTVADEFQFNYDKILTTNPDNPTKRSALSQMAQIFDVIGVFQPFVLKAKIMMQQLWSIPDMGWDTPLPAEMTVEWKSWCAEVPLMNTIKLPRWIEKEKDDRLYIACFGDASLVALGTACYSVVQKQSGEIVTHLLLSRARVAPKKLLETDKCMGNTDLSIARLELLAALMTATAGEFLRQTLGVAKEDVHFFTDSTVTLHRLIKGPGAWKQWVGARIKSTLVNTDSDHWYYINTADNPADLASRGAMASELLDCKQWMHGPPVLQTPIEEWKQLPDKIKNPNFSSLEAMDERETAVANLFLTRSASDRPFGPLQRLMDRTNDFGRLKHRLAVLIHLMKQMGEKRGNKNWAKFKLTPDILHEAELHWIRLAQQVAWPTEAALPPGKMAVGNKTPLQNFGPVMDAYGIIRSRGRLQQIELEDYSSTPIILPKHSRLVEQLVLDIHVSNSHAPQETTLALLRERFTLLGSRQELRRILFTCKNKKCRKLEPLQPKMAPLPKERGILEAWVHIATDVLGPIFIKHSCEEYKKNKKKPLEERPPCPHQNHRKVWVIVFNCLTTRCVHLQILDNMSTEAVLQAVSNLISRRGSPKTIWSDNGKNYVGAQAELKKLFSRLDKKKLSDHGAMRGITWNFAVPTAPNQNGVSEACVKLTKNILYKTFKDNHLNYFQAETVILQAEAIINNRPLRAIVAGDDYIPITPAQLCLGRSLKVLPDVKVTPKSTNITKMLATRQHLLAGFWKAWIHQYLLELAPTKKWHKTLGREIKVGDVVMLREDKLKKNEYLFASVISLKKSRLDGEARSALLRTKKGEVVRPLNRLALFEEHVPSGQAEEMEESTPTGALSSN